MHSGILAVADKRGHLLSRGAVLPDHVHLLLGCPLEVSPEEVAMCYLNNLAFLLGMRPWFQFEYYVGTLGEYDRGAI